MRVEKRKRKGGGGIRVDKIKGRGGSEGGCIRVKKRWMFSKFCCLSSFRF